MYLGYDVRPSANMMLVVDCTITMMMIASLLTNVDCTTTWARGSRESRRCSELGPGTGTSKQASNGLHTPTTPLPPIIPTPSLRVFLYFELVFAWQMKNMKNTGPRSFACLYGPFWPVMNKCDITGAMSTPLSYRVFF